VVHLPGPVCVLSESEMGFWLWLILFASMDAESRGQRAPPRALNAWSRNRPRSVESDIRRLARALDIPLLLNSDAHGASDMGADYHELHEEAQDADALVPMLNAGTFVSVAPTGLRRISSSGSHAWSA